MIESREYQTVNAQTEFTPAQYLKDMALSAQVFGAKTTAFPADKNYLDFGSGGLVYGKIEDEVTHEHQGQDAVAQLRTDLELSEEEEAMLREVSEEHTAQTLRENVAFNQANCNSLISKLQSLDNTVVHTARHFHSLLLGIEGVDVPHYWSNDLESNAACFQAKQKIPQLARTANNLGLEFPSQQSGGGTVEQLAGDMARQGLLGVMGGALRYSPHHMALFRFLNDKSDEGRALLTEDNLKRLLDWVDQCQAAAIREAKPKAVQKQKNLGVWTKQLIRPEMATRLLQAAQSGVYIIPSWEGSALYFSFVNPADLSFSERMCVVKDQKLFTSHHGVETEAEFSTVLRQVDDELVSLQAEHNSLEVLMLYIYSVGRTLQNYLDSVGRTVQNSICSVPNLFCCLKPTQPGLSDPLVVEQERRRSVSKS